jgi:hypothetical protein
VFLAKLLAPRVPENKSEAHTSRWVFGFTEISDPVIRVTENLGFQKLIPGIGLKIYIPDNSSLGNHEFPELKHGGSRRGILYVKSKTMSSRNLGCDVHLHRVLLSPCETLGRAMAC